MSLRELIMSDLARWDKPNFANLLKWMIMPKGSTIPYCFWLRLTGWAKRRRITKYTLGLLFYFFYRHYGFKYGITIDASMPIGKGLKIAHGGCVFVNCKSVGDHFTVYQCVTLGSDTNSSAIPTVKDNVTIYTGSVVVGDIVINSNSTIGCNSYVHNSIPKNCLYAGTPAKLIKEI